MKGKPIEPGCLALVIGPGPQPGSGPGNSGRVVRVVRRVVEPYYIGPRTPAIVREHGGIKCQGTWLCATQNMEPDLKCRVFKDSDVAAFAEWLDAEKPFGEKYLIRLDDDEITDDVVERDLETI